MVDWDEYLPKTIQSVRIENRVVFDELSKTTHQDRLQEAARGLMDKLIEAGVVKMETRKCINEFRRELLVYIDVARVVTSSEVTSVSNTRLSIDADC